MASFARDIRPRFTDEDVDHMLPFTMNLGDYESVKSNAPLIYERLADGTMPPGAPWPEADVTGFKQWMDEGCPA